MTVHLRGANLATLQPYGSMNLTLVVAGGSPVPLSSTSNDATGFNLKFDRQLLIASIKAGIASGAITPSKLKNLEVRLMAGTRLLGSDNIGVIEASPKK